MTISLSLYHYPYYCLGAMYSFGTAHGVFFFLLSSHQPHGGGTTIILILPMRKRSPERANNWTWIMQLRAGTAEWALKAITPHRFHIHAFSHIFICEIFLFDSLSSSNFIYSELIKWLISSPPPPPTKSLNVLSGMMANTQVLSSCPK